MSILLFRAVVACTGSYGVTDSPLRFLSLAFRDIFAPGAWHTFATYAQMEQATAAAAASGIISIRSTRDDRLAFLATTNDKVYLENDILNSNEDNDDCTIENSRDKMNGAELVL